MGTNIIFHLPLPPHRLYIHHVDNTYCLKPLTINDLIHTHTEISMFINNQTIIPNIASYDGIVWNSVDNNNILGLSSRDYFNSISDHLPIIIEIEIG